MPPHIAMQDVYLEQIGTSMSNFQMRVSPFSGSERSSSQDMEVEVLFENNQITIEMHDIFVDGTAMITDTETKHLELIHFRAPVSTANVVLDPEVVMRGNNDMYPKFEVIDVGMDIDMVNAAVSVQGDTPLFKTKKFEEAVKRWLKKESS